MAPVLVAANGCATVSVCDSAAAIYTGRSPSVVNDNLTNGQPAGNTARQPCVVHPDRITGGGTTAMVVTARVLLFVACCAFAVAACTNPNADASNTQSNRAATSTFNTDNGGGGGGGGGGY
jgi:hypothetical protein